MLKWYFNLNIKNKFEIILIFIVLYSMQLKNIDKRLTKFQFLKVLNKQINQLKKHENKYYLSYKINVYKPKLFCQLYLWLLGR